MSMERMAARSINGLKRVGHSLPESCGAARRQVADAYMEALKLAHGDLAALVECAHAAHQVGDLLIVKVMAIAVGVAVVLPANEVVAGFKLRGIVTLKRRGELGAGFGANGLARHALVVHKLPKADGDDAAWARLAHQGVEHAYAVLA